MKNKLVAMFDKREFVLVCRKYDSANDANDDIDEVLFLVFRDEWEEPYDPFKCFDLILTSIEGNEIKLYPAPNNSIGIYLSLPYERRADFIEIPITGYLN